VAFIGFHHDSETLIIAAMVLAPLLGPNISAAFASLIGNKNLWKKAMRASIAGVGTCLLTSCVLGWFFPLDFMFREVAARTIFSWSILALALVSGVAGALTFTTALSEALVGVMVGIALLPPIVITGAAMVMGLWQESLGAALIFVANLSGLHLAATATFRIKGIEPKYWYDKKSARKVTILSLIIWLFLISVVIYIQLNS
jgi:uncharacterized hydrophobic protein (TIGR00341 family)